MSDALGYLLTWTTYGSWLQGDERGWVRKEANGIQKANEKYVVTSQNNMSESVFTLGTQQRKEVKAAILETCDYRGWHIFAINVRNNHVHVVIKSDKDAKETLRILKAYGSRRLNETEKIKRKYWWTKGSSTRYINEQNSLAAAIVYVENQ